MPYEKLDTTPSLYSHAQAAMQKGGLTRETMTVFLLAQAHPLLKVLPAQQAEDKDNTTQVLQEVALPSTERSILNQGVLPSQGNYIPQKFGLTTRRALFQCPMSLLTGRNQASSASFLMRQNRSFTQSLANKVTETILTGVESDTQTNSQPTKGLSQVYDGSGTRLDDKIISAGGTTTDKQSSAWFLNWDGGNGIGLSYGFGGTMGVSKVIEKGVNHANPASDSSKEIYHYEFYDQSIGVNYFNPYAAVRLANLDRPALNNGTLSALSLGKAFIRSLNRLADHVDVNSMNTGIFCSNELIGALQIEFYGSTFGAGGRMGETNMAPNVMNFNSIPVHRERALALYNEAVLTI